MTHGATDLELFMFYSEHLDNPCSVMVDGQRHDIRLFYETLATEALERFSNPYLKSLLEKKIKECSKVNAPFSFSGNNFLLG